MSEIDRRFLTVHPRTTLWWAQRVACDSCAHMRRHVGNCRATENTLIMCAATPAGRYTGFASCIDAREPGRPCGPDATLRIEVTP